MFSEVLKHKEGQKSCSPAKDTWWPGHKCFNFSLSPIFSSEILIQWHQCLEMALASYCWKKPLGCLLIKNNSTWFEEEWGIWTLGTEQILRLKKTHTHTHKSMRSSKPASCVPMDASGSHGITYSPHLTLHSNCDALTQVCIFSMCIISSNERGVVTVELESGPPKPIPITW